MTRQLAEAIEIIRELPDNEQDSIARQLILLVDLAQTTDAEVTGDLPAISRARYSASD